MITQTNIKLYHVINSINIALVKCNKIHTFYIIKTNKFNGNNYTFTMYYIVCYAYMCV